MVKRIDPRASHIAQCARCADSIKCIEQCKRGAARQTGGADEALWRWSGTYRSGAHRLAGLMALLMMSQVSLDIALQLPPRQSSCRARSRSCRPTTWSAPSSCCTSPTCNARAAILPTCSRLLLPVADGAAVLWLRSVVLATMAQPSAGSLPGSWLARPSKASCGASQARPYPGLVEPLAAADRRCSNGVDGVVAPDSRRSLLTMPSIEIEAEGAAP